MTTAFKSQSAQDKALQVYDKILASWPVPYKSQLISTTFGKTHIIVSGKTDAQPLVLLHGGGGNATMWSHNIATLAEHFQVFAIDIIGELGKSAPTRPKYHSDGHADWLNEVLQALDLKKPSICGASLGSWIAYQFTLKYSEHLDALILLGPPTLLKMRLPFILRALLTTLFPIPSIALSFLKYISHRAQSLSLSDPIAQDFIAQLQSYKPNNHSLPVITEEQLAKLPPKTLLMLGDNEVIFNPQTAAKKVQSAAPHIKIIMLPHTGHTIPFDQPDIVNQHIIQFLS